MTSECTAVSRRQTYNYPHLAKGDYFVRGHTEGSPQDAKKQETAKPGYNLQKEIGKARAILQQDSLDQGH